MGDLRRAVIACMPRPGSLSVANVHESGHAVAQFLTAARLGIAPEDAVGSIEMRLNGGTTFSTFSPEIQQAAGRVHARYSTDGATEMPAVLEALWRERPREYYSLVMAEAHKSGADIAMWLDATITIGVAGSSAQALYLNRSFAQVIRSQSCGSDVAKIARSWRIAALVIVFASIAIQRTGHKALKWPDCTAGSIWRPTRLVN